jgi:hypothetical protein
LSKTFNNRNNPSILWGVILFLLEYI